MLIPEDMLVSANLNPKNKLFTFNIKKQRGKEIIMPTCIRYQYTKTKKKNNSFFVHDRVFIWS